MVEWIIRSQQQAWLHMNTTQTAQHHLPSPSSSSCSSWHSTTYRDGHCNATAISIFIQLLTTVVYQSSFQVSVKISNSSATQPPVLRTPHRIEDDLSKTQQSVESSATDAVEHRWVFSMTLLSPSREDDTTQAIYSRTSDASLKYCILEFLHGYGVSKVPGEVRHLTPIDQIKSFLMI